MGRDSDLHTDEHEMERVPSALCKQQSQGPSETNTHTAVPCANQSTAHKLWYDMTRVDIQTLTNTLATLFACFETAPWFWTCFLKPYGSLVDMVCGSTVCEHAFESAAQSSGQV